MRSTSLGPIMALLIPLGFVLVAGLLATAVVGSLKRSPTGQRQRDEARASRRPG